MSDEEEDWEMWMSGNYDEGGQHDINKYDDAHVTGGNGVRSCGEFGAEGIGGMAVGEEVMFGVLRGSAAVVDIVEGKSNAYNTTKIATTYENGDDDNMTTVLTTQHDEPRSMPQVMLDLCVPPDNTPA